jgi:DHA2 family multidrug resistance protein
MLVSHTYPGNPAFENLVNGISHALQSAGVEATAATHQAYARVMGMVQLQAAALAYVKVISIMALLVACLIPIPMIMRRPPRRKPGDQVAMH